MQYSMVWVAYLRSSFSAMMCIVQVTYGGEERDVDGDEPVECCSNVAPGNTMHDGDVVPQHSYTMHSYYLFFIYN